MSSSTGSGQPDDDAQLDDDAQTDDDARTPDASPVSEGVVVQGDPDPSPEPAQDPDFEGVDITASDGPVLEEGPDVS